MECFHVRETRVLQVLCRTDDGVGIRLCLEDMAKYGFQKVARHLIRGAVLLLIHILQLALETTIDRSYQALRVQPAPLLHILRQE